MYPLSKSKLMSSLQCAKRLFLEVHQPELAYVSGDLEARFASGHRVGEVAQSLYPEGRLIGHGDDPSLALQETQAALAVDGDLLLFEPAFSIASNAIPDRKTLACCSRHPTQAYRAIAA